MKRILTMLAAIFVCAAAFAQGQLVTWSSHLEKAEDGTYRVIFTGKIAEGYHTYTLTDEFSATEIMDAEIQGGEMIGDPYELSTPVEETDEFGDPARHYYNEIIIAQNVKANDGKAVYTGTIFTNACTGGACKAEYYDFNVKVGDSENAVMPIADTLEPADEVAAPEEEKGSIWGLIIEAILWGFAMLLTPCVFPMVPMTVSFFMKGSENVAAGRFKAAMYGLFIVLLYTVPISVIIMLTKLIGGDAVTADIFNWLSTHWLPNIIFFIVFMIFAASFFGAFEITLPESIVNKSDKNSDKKGLAGVFFMALTLVLVSFSCTGPIVGSVLIKSTQGEFWEPMVTMLAFSVAFALPFTVLAFFPSLLKKFKKSGGSWLNSVKVVLGFVEVALGLKFLSVADQTYHWGILDREIYLALWIVIFTLLGFYLLGKLKFKHDSEVKYIGVPRLILSIIVFAFVVYMIPGMWGAPLKGLSGYMPPIQTQDFVIEKYAGPVASTGAVSSSESAGRKYADFLHLPYNLEGFFDLEEAKDYAAKQDKPIFIDCTGHGCVNCREMEARVWSDERVLDHLRNNYVVTALYVDDKKVVAEEDWVVTESGKTLKRLGDINSHYALTEFKVNAQPYYVLMSPEGKVLVEPRAYDLSVDGFIKFLESGLAAYEIERIAE